MIQIKTSTPFVGFVDSRQGGRIENQDACGYADTPLGLVVVVCDGMGGGPGGKVASSIAVEVIIQTLRTIESSSSRAEMLQIAIKTANQALLCKVKEQPALKGMGTTVVALLLNESSAIVAHVGDSRCYQFRRSAKKYRTFDHSMVFELVKNGTLTEEQARLSAQANVITRALGLNVDVEAELCELPYEKGDRFMLCTDGIWGLLPENKLVKIAAGTKSLGGSVESLVIQADEHGFANDGKHDNLTVALIETKSNSILKEKMSTKVRNLLLGLAVICCLSMFGNVMQFLYTPRDPVAMAENTEAENIEFLLNQKTEEMSKELEKRFQQTIDSLSELILKKKELNTAKKFLQDYNEKQTVVEKLDTIIEQLKRLREMEAGTPKSEIIKKTINSIEGLAPELKKYGVSDKELTDERKGALALLGQGMAQRNSGQSKGHYDAIIKSLISVKDKVRN